MAHVTRRLERTLVTTGLFLRKAFQGDSFDVVVDLPGGVWLPTRRMPLERPHVDGIAFDALL